jgi:hypothetical protein
MMIISDLHIGVQRAGGTTPQSQQALRDYLRNSLESLLATESEWVVVNGDLFDKFTVDTSEVLLTCEIFYRWLGERPSAKLTLISGNHDWSPRGNDVSSFHLLAAMLQMSGVGHDVEVRDHTNGLSRVDASRGVFCVPHMPNQALFDAEIQNAAATPGKGRYLLLHCNYKNTFADHSDHSLNLSDDQVGALMEAGWSLIIGHEHIGYSLRGGRVLVVGNQFPSSVSDCLGNQTKHAVRLTDTGLELVQTWSRDGSYVEADWRALDGVKAQFIRVTGEATSAEAAEVIKAISTLRQTSDAFVITNAVKVAGHDMSGEKAAESIENLRAFDVVGAIMAELNEQEQEVVKGLMA